MSLRRLIALPIVLLAAPPLAAQDPIDSLRQRLEDMERMVQVLQVQVAEQAEARVEPRSGARVELSGLVLFNGFYNDAAVNNGDVPLMAMPANMGGLPDRTLGGTARQSRITLTTFAPYVLGAEFTGVLDLDFFGGHQSLGRLFPVPHLRIVRGELRWPNAWILFGQEAAPISEVNPSSVAAIGLPGFSMSGNLWFWIPQARVGADAGIGEQFRIGIEGAVLAPHIGGASAGLFPSPNLAERSGRPYVQGRVLGRWGDPGLAGGEVSLGGHYGWIATDGDSLLATRAVAASARLFVTEYVELRGEIFSGEALDVLGGGGVGQGFGANGAPVSTKGGWAQLNALPTPAWEIGAGFGLDDPDDNDLPPGAGRLKNLSYEGHVIWRPEPVVFGLEFRRLRTTFGNPTMGEHTANHVNLAMGFMF